MGCNTFFKIDLFQAQLAFVVFHLNVYVLPVVYQYQISNTTQNTYLGEALLVLVGHMVNNVAWVVAC